MQTKKIKLKVCGMRDTLNIEEIGALRPDYMGFIFYRGSRRFVGEDFVIPEGLSPEIERVGVFVNEDPSVILQVAKDNRLDFVQLHGQESPEQCGMLVKHGLGVIKVFNVGDKFDFSRTSEYVGVADYFLFDADGPLSGGNGLSFDWRHLNSYSQQLPFFLSGGISPANIHGIELLKGMNLHAVDVNSGVEKGPALKEKELVMKLINKMNKYDV